MNRENVFFGKEGMTSTSANFLANIAKELVQADQQSLEGVSFYDTTITSLLGVECKYTNRGLKSCDGIEDKLTRIGEMKSFCAWVREAIKERDAMLESVKNKRFSDWLVENNIDLNHPKEVPATKYWLEEEVMAEWSKSKLQHYYDLEAKASTLGKYIHPNGAFSCAREAAHKAVTNPTTVQGQGRDAVIWEKKLTVSIDSIDAQFMKLQTLHREYEKELNFMKAELKDDVAHRNMEAEAQYQTDLEQYQSQMREFNARSAKATSEYSEWKISEANRISSLKIVLPESLMPTFRELSKWTSK